MISIYRYQAKKKTPTSSGVSAGIFNATTMTGGLRRRVSYDNRPVEKKPERGCGDKHTSSRSQLTLNLSGRSEELHPRSKVRLKRSWTGQRVIIDASSSGIMSRSITLRCSIEFRKTRLPHAT